MNFTTSDTELPAFHEIHGRRFRLERLPSWPLACRCATSPSSSAGWIGEKWQETSFWCRKHNKEHPCGNGSYHCTVIWGGLVSNYTMVKTMVSCRLSLKPVQWFMGQNSCAPMNGWLIHINTKNELKSLVPQVWKFWHTHTQTPTLSSGCYKLKPCWLMIIRDAASQDIGDCDNSWLEILEVQNHPVRDHKFCFGYLIAVSQNNESCRCSTPACSPCFQLAEVVSNAILQMPRRSSEVRNSNIMI